MRPNNATEPLRLGPVGDAAHALAIRQDYIIEPSERDTIGIAVAEVPERVELRDLHTLPPRELAMAVTSVLQVLQSYRAALRATEA